MARSSIFTALEPAAVGRRRGTSSDDGRRRRRRRRRRNRSRSRSRTD